MGDCSPRKRALFPILVMAGFAILRADGPAQEASSRTAKGPMRQWPDGSAAAQAETAGPAQLSRQLKYFRTVGDLERAAWIFDRIFSPGSGVDPASVLKVSPTLPSNGDGAPGIDKPIAANEGAYPVFVSREHEKRPSADVSRSMAGDWAVYSAAEQWMGDAPGAIRVRKSSDRGLTWSETMLIGDGRALTHPSLRQVSDDTLGLAYVREWDDADGDIWFSRFGEGMMPDGGHPVDIGLSDQMSPSLATDRPDYSAPYVYIAYADREGPTISVKLRVSRDLGASWSREITIDAFPCEAGTAIETALAYDPGKSTLHVAYSRPQALSMGIATSTSTSFGASWSKPAFLTAFDLHPEGSPAIAAGGGTVVVVYEHGPGGPGQDIELAYSTDSGRRWTRSVGLASSAARESSPDVRASVGTGMPRFFASYVEENGRVWVLSAAGSAPGSWTTESSFPDGDAPLSLGSAIVVPVPGPDGEPSAGTLWSETTSDEDIYFSAPPIAIILATLTVTPANRDVPFTAGTTTFAVAKAGSGRVDWTAAVTSGQEWLSIAAGASGTNAGTITTAHLANPGTAPRTGTIRVTPADVAISAVDVTVTQAGAPLLAVTPAGGFVSAGDEGGPFDPATMTYTFENAGGTVLAWTATATGAWLTLSPASGTLDPGATVTMRVAISADAEALAAGLYTDTLAFTNTTNGAGTTIRPVTLTVNRRPGTLAVTPLDGLDAAGPVGGPFSPPSKDFLLQNVGATAIDWTAAAVEPWLSLSSLSGALGPGESITVAVAIGAAAGALNPGTYGDTVVFTNVTNGRGSASRPVTLTVTVRGALTVTPAGGLVSTGPVGGPFTPSSQSYSLQNTGGTSISWTAAGAQAWTTLSAASGILDVGHVATVTVSIGAGANTFPAGAYNDTIAFTNTTNGAGNATRPVTLNVVTAGALLVSPAGGLVSTGLVGGPFTPSVQSYTLQNTGAAEISWAAAKTQAWTTLSNTSGTLGAGASTTVTLTINAGANSLAAGTYNDTATFANTTNGTGTTTRPVSLTVGTVPALSISPASRDVDFVAGTTTFNVSNTGGGTMDWTAAVVAGGDWLTISSGTSGTEAGTITLAYAANRTAAPRVGIVRIAAAGASGSPRDVTVTQSQGSIGLGLGVERLVEKAWIIQREYAKLTVAVTNPATIPVERYVIYRKDGALDFQVRAEVPGPAAGSVSWSYNDTFLDLGTAYSYRVVALDALGNVISQSGDITI